jgi:hypothetical protein
LLAVLLLALSWAGAARAQGFPPVWQSWLTALTQAGYTVTPGAATVGSVAYCEQVVDPVFGTCFISDPEDPYVFLQPPVEPGQYVDPYFGQIAAQTLPNGTVVSTAFRLNTTEAELVIVNLPPTAAYFSYQGYVFTRPIADYKTFSGRISPDPARADLAASTNNSIDDVTYRAPFGVQWPQGVIAFITTPNASIAGDMARYFSAVGGNPAFLFTDPLGSNTHPGLDQTSDDFQSVMRYLNPEDSTAATNWLNNIAANVQVYRIVPPASLHSSRYGVQMLRNKYTNTDESIYAADLTELGGIMKNWLKTQESTRPISVVMADGSEKVSPRGVIEYGSVGFSCIKNGTNCNDDEQDGLHWNNTVGSIPSGHLFVLAGVNQAVTNNTTILSLSVTDAITNTGVLGISQTNPGAAGFATGNITGSAVAALQYLGLWSQASPQLQHDAPNMFVQLFTRDCAAPQDYCTQSFTTDIPTSLIPSAHPMYIDQRSYVLPGYPNSASPNELLRYLAIY